MKYHYIVIVPTLVGSVESCTTNYAWDGLLYKTRNAAIGGGWKIHGHDDWLIGVLRDDQLVRLAWMDEDRDDADELIEVAAALKLEVAA